MAGTLPPGIGNPQQAMQATAFIRQQPWYLQWIAARGKRPDSNGNVRLSDDEQTQLRDLIVAKGIGLNNKFDGIDENGQIVEEHHKLRNGLIAAAIGGAALTGFGAAGIGPLSGAFGAGAGAAGAGTGAGVGIGESAATGIGGLSATSLGLPVTAGLGTAGAASAAGAAPLSTLLSGANSIVDLGPVSPSAFGGASTSVLPSFAGAVPDLGAVSPLSFSSAGVPDLGAVSPLPGLQGPLAGDIGNVIGPGISGMGTGPSAAPATSLPDWLKTAQKTGDALSALSAGRAEGRLAEGQANQAQNRAAVDLYNTELNAPRTIARNAVKGDVLANAQDVHIDRPSTIPDFNITGGLRPSMFSDATRATGRNISAAASRTPIPSPTAPVLPDLPQASGLDSFLNTASTISGLSRAVPPSAWAKIAGLF